MWMPLFYYEYGCLMVFVERITNTLKIKERYENIPFYAMCS